MTDFQTGDKVRIREGLPYTRAMRGHTFTVTRVLPYTYGVEITNDVTGRSGLRFRAADLVPVTECLYCGAEVPAEDVPDVDDDPAWNRLDGFHEDGCEWVATRAHRD